LPTGSHAPRLKENEVESISRFLTENGMSADPIWLVEAHRRGLSLAMAKTVYDQNRERYEGFSRKLRQPAEITGAALFNAFMLDCERHLRNRGYQAI
jgi:hypothetical protein